MPTPTFTAPPPAPQRLTDSRTGFVAKADPLIAWLSTMVSEFTTAVAWVADQVASVLANAIAAEAAADAALNASTYASVTTALLNHATGIQTFNVAAGLSFDATLTPQVALILLSDDSVRMTGNVTAYNPATGSMTVNITRIRGAGASGTGWAVMLKAFEGLSPEGVEALAIALS